MSTSVLDRARLFVSKMPAAVSGSNGHGATFHVACVLVQGFDLSLPDAMVVLEEYNARCLPPWSTQELQHKLEGAEKAPGLKRKSGHVLPRGCLVNALDFKPSKEYRRYFKLEPPKKPEFDAAALQKFAGDWRGKIDLLWLAARSAEDPCTVTSNRFLELLYRPRHTTLFSGQGDAHKGEKVLIFTNDKSQALWPDDQELPTEGPDGVWFLAQPVDGKYHPNPRSLDREGKPRMSRRSEESVTAWRYFVIESDKAPAKLWLSAIVQMPLRIAALYSSGSRSVHALVRVDARIKNEWDAEKEAVKRVLVTLGACLGSMSAVRLTRLPGTLRHGKTITVEQNGKKRDRYVRFPRPGLQKLLFINPDPPMRPLCELAPRRDVLKPWLQWASSGIADSDETNGAALTRALHYYAPVSEICRVELKRLLHAKTAKV
jgi:hypothetical protein